MVPALQRAIPLGGATGLLCGLNVGNTRLNFIVDVPRMRVEEIAERLRKAYSGVEPEGTDPHVFP